MQLLLVSYCGLAILIYLVNLQYRQICTNYKLKPFASCIHVANTHAVILTVCVNLSNVEHNNEGYAVMSSYYFLFCFFCFFYYGSS